MCVQSALANQAIHPFVVGTLVPAISRGNNAWTVMGVELVAACTCKCNVALVTRVEPTALSAHHR